MATGLLGTDSERDEPELTKRSETRLDESITSDTDLSSACVARDEGYQSTSTISSDDILASRALTKQQESAGIGVLSVVDTDQEIHSDTGRNYQQTSDEKVPILENMVSNKKRRFQQNFWKNMLTSNLKKTTPEYKRSRSHSLPDILESISNIQIRGRTIFGGDRSASKDDIDQQSSDVSDEVSDAPLSSPLPVNTPICGNEHMEDACYYCLKDNEIYCNLCVHIHNYHCTENVKYIPEMPPELRANVCAETKNELLSMKYRFEKVKQENEIKLETLKNDRRIFLHSLMRFKERVIYILDCIEKDALEAMNAVYIAETKRHDENLVRLETIISDLESYMSNVESKDCGNNIDVMFTLQESSKAVMNYEPILFEIHKYSHSLGFTFDPSEEFLDNASDLWAMKKTETMSCSAPAPCSCDRSFRYRRAHHENNASVKCSSFRSFDREMCNITGCDFLDNGNLILADNNNRKVKLVDTKYKMVSVLTVPSLPWDVCAIDSGLALVSLPDKKQLQFLGTSPKLSLKHAISVDKNCWGVAKCKNDIVVTCWSFDTSHILIMDTLGNQKRLIQTSNGEPFHTAWYVTSWNDVIHVSDWGTFNVSCLSKTGATISKYKDKSLRGPVGITSDPEGNVYVCGRDSNNVHQLSFDGKQQQMLVRETDGIYKPLCICHCPKDDRLVVTSWMSDTLHVFRLK